MSNLNILDIIFNFLDIVLNFQRKKYKVILPKKGIKKMKNKKTAKSKLLNLTVKTIEKTVKNDANSTSCMIFYQPKAPASLKKFSKAENDK